MTLAPDDVRPLRAAADHGPSVLRSVLRRSIDVKVSHKPACQSLLHTRAIMKRSATALRTCHTRRRARRPYTNKRCALLMHRADIQTATSRWRRLLFPADLGALPPYVSMSCIRVLTNSLSRGCGGHFADCRKLKSPATGIAGLSKVTLGTQSSLPERTRYSPPSQMMV